MRKRRRSPYLRDPNISLMYHAIVTDQVDAVDQVLAAGLSVDCEMCHYDKLTPLHVAVSRDKINVIKRLLSRNADINKKALGFTPLEMAVSRKSDMDIIKILIEAIKDDEREIVTERLIGIAAFYGNILAMEYLFSIGANVNDYIHHNDTPLLISLFERFFDQKSRLEMVQFLLSKGVDVNVRDKFGDTPLHCAARIGCFEYVKLLVDYNCDINAKNNNKKSPLAYAITAKSTKIIRFLLENGSENVNETADNGNTPLHCAAQSGDLDLVQYILKLNPDIHVKNQYRETPLSCAVTSQNIEIINLLIKCGSDVNNTDDSPSRTMLNQAQQVEDFQTMSCLLENGADVDAVDAKGLPPIINFMLSVPWHPPTLRLLLRHNANINVYDEDKRNLLSVEDESLFNPYINHWEILITHIAKLKAMGLHVNPDLIDTIVSKKQFNDHFEKCKRELEEAKEFKFDHCWVTFFNILTDSKSKLVKYARNQHLVEAYKNKSFKQKFPVYRAEMVNRFAEAIKFRILWDVAADGLSNLLPSFGPKHFVIQKTLSCLNKKDLHKLCN